MGEKPITPDFRRGYYEACAQVCNFINSLDTSEMKTAVLRSAIYHHCNQMTPALSPTSSEKGRE